MLIRPTLARPWISMHAATVGAAAAGIAASLLVAPNAQGLAGAALAGLMAATADIDARQYIIPNELNAAGLALALANAGLQETPVDAMALAVLRGAVLAVAFFGLRVAYRMIRKREGIGLGDVKLAGVAGAWLDWTTMPFAVEIAAASALVAYAARQYAVGRAIHSTSVLPFGLFFAPAIWFGWLLEMTWLARY